MKIRSKHKDYYDNTELWHDESRQWFREKEVIRQNENQQLFNATASFMANFYRQLKDKLSIGQYCDDYPSGIIVNDRFYPYEYFVYREDGQNKHMIVHNEKTIERSRKYEGLYGSLSDNDGKVDERWFAEPSYPCQLNSMLNQPLVLVKQYDNSWDGRNTYECNVNLIAEGLTFIDPTTLHDEIERWIFDVAGAKYPEPLPLTEKEKLASKGFDKYSFKSDAPPARKKRKEEEKLKRKTGQK